jgi:hypothetical protein
MLFVFQIITFCYGEAVNAALTTSAEMDRVRAILVGLGGKVGMVHFEPISTFTN